MPAAKKKLVFRILKFLERKTSFLLTAFMLGMSNVILDEDRSVIETRAKIEQQEIQSEED
jgi:hypothetical protein